MSGMNWAIIAIVAASAIIRMLQGERWFQILGPLVVAFFWWGGARMARWRDSKDIERIMAFEPADEREESISQIGLAPTGRFALLFLLAQSILLFYLAPQMWPYSVGTLALFGLVWYFATTRAIRQA
ncbi:hypothetical protein ACFFIO_03555 [Citricoccus parietis]|uniref:DUF2178 domain-containing protein n=1 Tax=Citricoccus parietis TaxID=592307 RepID=A0ABV6F2L6_9MICC